MKILLLSFLFLYFSASQVNAGCDNCLDSSNEGAAPYIQKYGGDPCFTSEQMMPSWFSAGFKTMCITKAEGGSVGFGSCTCEPESCCKKPAAPTSCGSCIKSTDNKVVADYFQQKSWWVTGDPCFLSKGQRMCVTKVNEDETVAMGMCDEKNPLCGAKDAPEPQPPTCDNSKATNDLPKKYCDLKIDGVENTMCQYTGMGAGCLDKVCDVAGPTGITAIPDIQQILDAHNKYRRAVAKGQVTGAGGAALPSATDMMEIKWNQDLAESAQRYADQCDVAHPHDKNRCIASPCGVATNPGQNMATIGRPPAGINMTDPTDRWYGEEIGNVKPEFIAGYPKDYTGPVIGHATQVIWAKTTEVGCGYVTWRKSESETCGLMGIFMCNYNVGGNMEGGAIYTAGDVAKDCPNGDTDGLCKW